MQNINDKYKSKIQSLEDKIVEYAEDFELEQKNLCLSKDQEIKELKANVRDLEEELRKKEKM